jgi:G3E family GTPase
LEQSETVPSGQQIPISVLTGFLGSGKTTVLNRLLRHPAMAKAMVIVNEFGEIGLDHELVESATEDMVLLQSGCLCCTIRSDLIDTLRTLFLKRVRGDIAEFDRVVIETTGLADPAPILQTLMTDPLVATRFRLDGVLATVDAAAGQATLDRQIEAVKQAAVADRLLLTKTDLVGEDDVCALERRLRALNPAAPILRTVAGNVEPGGLFDIGLYDPKTKSIDVRRWLAAETYVQAGHRQHDSHGDHDHGAHRDDVAGRHPAHNVNRHDDHIKAVCLIVDEPIPGPTLDCWLDMLFRLKGPDLLRFKGIVNVSGLKGPLVIHGVQHVIHPPLMLKAWPSEDRRTRMVFITRDLDEVMLRDSLKLFTADGASP